MHMADALISPAVGGVMWAATAGLAARAMRKTGGEPDADNVAMMGVMGAFVFSAQMLNFAIPGTGSSGHLGGGLLLAILLGPYRGFLTMASVLLIQALFFADGGLLAYGANAFNLGFFPCFLIHPLLYRPWVGKNPTGKRLFIASLLCAIVGLQLGAFGVVVETVWSGMTSLSLGAFAALMQPIHLAIGVVEGLITAAVVGYVWKTSPDLLYSGEKFVGGAPASRRHVLAALAAAAILAGGGLSWFASSYPDGLEWALGKAGAAEIGAGSGVHAALADVQERIAVLPDYDFPRVDGAAEIDDDADGEAGRPWPAVNAGTSVSGLAGGAVTALLAVAIGAAVTLVRKRDAWRQ